MTWREGDYCRHKLDPDHLLCVVRVQTDWLGEAVLLVRDAEGMRPPSETFKVTGADVRKVPR